MADYEDTKVSNLIINNISQEKYDELAAAGELDPTQVYLTPTEAAGGDFATKDYVDTQVLDTFDYLNDADTTIRSNINQLDKNIRTVADWVNVKDEEGNRAVLETEAQDAYRAINELNTKVNDCLPLSGGTLTGALEFEWSGNYQATEKIILKTKYHRLDTDTIISNDVASVNPNGLVSFVRRIHAPGFWPKRASGQDNLGNTFYCFGKTFTQKINAGRQNSVDSGDLIVPTEGGTLARLEDLEGLGLVEVLPTADNGYTTVKNFGNNYIEATGIYEVGSLEANAETVDVISFPDGVQFEEGQMYWANAYATTEDTNGNVVVATIISRGTSDITIVCKNLGSTDVENLIICWEVRGMLATA